MIHMDLTPELRQRAWSQLEALCESFYTHTADLPVTPVLNKKEIEAYAQQHSFDSPISVEEAIAHVAAGLKNFAVLTPHPMYYGLFNPRPTFPSMMADVLTAYFNPQMAAWSHSPFAVEAEAYVIRELAQKFGYAAIEADGVFTSGGAEANHTALLCALTNRFPEYPANGLQALVERPVFYMSEEGHHSFLKAAMNTGLGREQLRFVPVMNDLRMDVVALERFIQQDICEGRTPFMVISTLGTTGVGAIDDIHSILPLKERYNLWLHADGAYGGGLGLTDQHRNQLGPVFRADSITIDAHKWMSVPMGAGIFLTRHPNILTQTFAVNTTYMPHDEMGQSVVDPYHHSIQWSRRFTGLKAYMSLLVFGWRGYEKAIDHMMETGRYLKAQLKTHGFLLHNETALPIACFSPDPARYGDIQMEQLHRALLDEHRTWVSLYPVQGQQTLRACITNYSTDQQHIDLLISLLRELAGRTS